MQRTRELSERRAARKLEEARLKTLKGMGGLDGLGGEAAKEAGAGKGKAGKAAANQGRQGQGCQGSRRQGSRRLGRVDRRLSMCEVNVQCVRWGAHRGPHAAWHIVVREQCS